VISVLIVESHAAVRDAFGAVLDLHDDIAVVALASTGREAVNLAWLHEPDVALVNTRLADGSGFGVVEQLRAAVPGARCIMLTSRERPGYINRAYEEGAWAFLTMTVPFAEIVTAIHDVHAGRRLLHPRLGHHGHSPLSGRETAILQVAAKMSSTAEIATELHLSQGTINNYISAILAKLGATNRTQAVMIAQANGWL